MSPAAVQAAQDHWIYDADVELYDDFDEDGFHHFLSVRIDADSWRSSAWVFAELYLSADGRTWEHYHSTEDFWIGGIALVMVLIILWDMRRRKNAWRSK